MVTLEECLCVADTQLAKNMRLFLDGWVAVAYLKWHCLSDCGGVLHLMEDDDDSVVDPVPPSPVSLNALFLYAFSSDSMTRGPPGLPWALWNA